MSNISVFMVLSQYISLLQHIISNPRLIAAVAVFTVVIFNTINLPLMCQGLGMDMRIVSSPIYKAERFADVRVSEQPGPRPRESSLMSQGGADLWQV